MRYKIAYLTSTNPKDRDVSSGVHYYQSKALMDHCGEVDYLGPVNHPVINILLKIFRFLNRFLKKKYKYSSSLIISRIYGYIFSKKLKTKKYDFVFADKMALEIAYLKTDIPIIYSTDATFELLEDYYPGYTNLLDISRKEGHIHSQRAINNSSLIICTSHWAAKSINNDNGFPVGKVFVLPRGANIDHLPAKEKVLEKRKTETCRLLFMGKEWERKGYPIAFHTMKHIRSKGIPVKMTVIGFSPPKQFTDNDVTVIPYIDKNKPEERKLFDEIMFNSDFYFLPTRAECVAITISEAGAYGMPVITTNTGGISEVTKDGINGFALPYEAGPKEYADKIVDIFKDEKQYFKLILSSRDYFEERLNWDVWGLETKQILDNFTSMEGQNQK